MIGPGYTKTANGNILPMRFVSLTSVADRVVQSSGNSTPTWGVSQRGTRRAPLSPLDDTYAAVSGESLGIYGPGDDGCKLELGGTVAFGDRLTSDANGKGVTTTTTGQWVGAIALEAGASGDEIAVQPVYSAQY